MKILILTPTCLPDLTGNAITAERLRFGLSKAGIDVEVMRADSSGLSSIVGRFAPHIIHALHARKGGAAAMEITALHNIPYVVTMTGTDLYLDLPDSGKKEISTVLHGAGAVIAYSEITRESLLSRLPGLAPKVKVIKKGIHFKSHIEEDLPPPGKGAFLLPSGIRPVKAPSFAIAPLERLRKEFPLITLTVAGPRLNDEEWELFCNKAEGKKWIRHLSACHDDMPGLYAGADIVLNTSISEGLSNALLEAIHFGRPVLASDCEGNMAAIRDGKEGLLYKNGDEEDFKAKARLLLKDGRLRRELGRKGREKSLREHSLKGEIDAHMEIYKGLL